MQNLEVDDLSTPSSNNDDRSSLPSSKIQDDDISIPSSQEETKDPDKNNNNDENNTTTFDLNNNKEDVMNNFTVVNDQFDNNIDQDQYKDDGDEGEIDGDDEDDEDDDVGILQTIDPDIPVDQDDDYLSLNDNILTLKSETQISSKVYIYNIIIYSGIFAIRFGNFVDGFGFFFCASTQPFVGVVSDDSLVMHFFIR